MDIAEIEPKTTVGTTEDRVFKFEQEALLQTLICGLLLLRDCILSGDHSSSVRSSSLAVFWFPIKNLYTKATVQMKYGIEPSFGKGYLTVVPF